MQYIVSFSVASRPFAGCAEDFWVEPPPKIHRVDFSLQSRLKLCSCVSKPVTYVPVFQSL